jgi:hypothetical protein
LHWFACVRAADGEGVISVAVFVLVFVVCHLPVIASPPKVTVVIPRDWHSSRRSFVTFWGSAHLAP